MCVAALVLLIILRFKFHRTDRPITQAEQRSTADMPSEEIVERFVLSSEPDADAVRFERWGPHDLTGDLVNHRRGADDRIVRVRFQSTSHAGEPIIHDQLFYLLDGEVNQVIANSWGDDWRAAIAGLNDPKK